MSLLVLLPTETDPVLQEGRSKWNPGRSCGSSSSKIVLTLLTEVVAALMGLSAVYVQGTDLQLLPECLGNNGSRSENGNGSGNGSGSRNRSSSLQNSLKNPLQVIFGVLGDTISSRGISNGGFCLWESNGLVGQFITQLRRWRGVRGSDKGSGGGTLASGASAASDWGHLGADFLKHSSKQSGWPVGYEEIKIVKGRSLVPPLGHMQAWSRAIPGMLSVIG